MGDSSAVVEHVSLLLQQYVNKWETLVQWQSMSHYCYSSMSISGRHQCSGRASASRKKKMFPGSNPVMGGLGLWIFFQKVRALVKSQPSRHRALLIQAESLFHNRCKINKFNPFPHKDAFGPLCSRQFFKNIVTKEEIAQNEQFLLLPQCFHLLVIGYLFNYGDMVIH